MAKNKQKFKTPQKNNRSSQAVVLFCVKNQIGGAAGNRTPVRKVTDYLYYKYSLACVFMTAKLEVKQKTLWLVTQY